MFAGDVCNDLPCVHEGVSSFKRWEGTCDDFILYCKVSTHVVPPEQKIEATDLPRCRLGMIHHQFDATTDDSTCDLLHNFCLLSSRSQRWRVAPPVCIDSLDRVRVFEEDKLRLESNEERGIVGRRCAIKVPNEFLHPKDVREHALDDTFQHRSWTHWHTRA